MGSFLANMTKLDINSLYEIYNDYVICEFNLLYDKDDLPAEIVKHVLSHELQDLGLCIGDNNVKHIDGFVTMLWVVMSDEEKELINKYVETRIDVRVQEFKSKVEPIINEIIANAENYIVE